MFSLRPSSLLRGALLLLLLSASLPLPGRAAKSASSASTSSGAALDVSLFYDSLKDDGEWFNTTEFGDVWQPYIAYKSDAWRPYTDGYWTYTDGGWMFVSYENFGWAVYHYGRWTRLKDIGWAWVPGTDWSPAWVTWRENQPDDDAGQPPPAAGMAASDTAASESAPPREPSPSGSRGTAVREGYIGWAPLPPDPEPVVYEDYYSYGPSVDIDYGIDPYDYCFTDVRFFGAPWIGGVIFDRDRGYDCARRSINVTNVYYNRRGDYRGFYNGGPRYERFNGVTERPIQRFNLNRQQGRLAQDAVRAGRFNGINGNRLDVVAPRFSQTNVRKGRVNFKNRGTLPVSQVDRERPAAQAGNETRQQARDTFRQQGEAFRTQNPKSQSARRAAREARQTAAPAGGPGIATTPRAQREERQARRAAQQQAGANPATAAAQPQQTRAERRSARQEARASAARAQSGGGGGDSAAREARRAARQSARSQRVERSSAPSVPVNRAVAAAAAVAVDAPSATAVAAVVGNGLSVAVAAAAVEAAADMAAVAVAVVAVAVVAVAVVAVGTRAAATAMEVAEAAKRRNSRLSTVEKLLFVCSRNRLRSLTAEKLFEGFPAYQVRSVGTQPGARVVVTAGHLGWADLIFVMEKSHLNRLRRKFPAEMAGKQVVTLGIPDDYDFMQPELLDELRGKLGPYVLLPDD